jgi:hypothetical protein
MPHRSCFTFRTHGGVCAGERWLYDGDQPIARLQDDIVEQPEQNLRYFDQVLKPIELRQLRLAPGGPPLVAGVQLYWKMGAVITSELLAVEVEGQETERLQLTVITRDPGGVATSRRVLTLTYNDEMESYIYDFKAHLQIHSPEFFDNPQQRGNSDQIRFEYSDPWYSDVPAPSVEFPGMWEKRYSHLLAEPADGAVWQMPLNHMATGIPSPQSFKPNGLFVLGYEEGANPAFEFIGDTAARTSASVCNWGYDIHLSANYTFEELYAPICENFRIRLCADAKTREMLGTAQPIPRVEYGGFTELPMYERRTSFSRGMNLSQPTPGPTDPWPWLPAGEGTEWCRDEGRSDDFSMKISKDSSGSTEWIMDREGDGAWTPKWLSTTGFKITAYIKTQEVAGRGSFLALRWVVYNSPERFPYINSQKLVGTHDWTRVEAEIHGPPPPGVSGIAIVLRQDGSGTTWFDDLEVETLQGD